VRISVVAGSANSELGHAVATRLGVGLAANELDEFPDGEVRPAVEEMRGDDVYIIQPTSPPVNDHLVELCLLADACRRSGASRITAVVPYFGYARQDRRTRPGHGIGARVALGFVSGSGADRLIVVDPHSPTFEAMSPVPAVVLTARSVLVDAVRRLRFEPTVVVAPDLGAAKLAEHFGTALGARVAVVRKTRQTGTVVRAEDLVGDVAGGAALIVDDMITSGGTVEAAVRLVEAHGGRPVAAVATHGLFTEGASARLDALGLRGVVVTDTVAAPARRPATLKVVDASGVLADAVGRLHREERLDDVSGWD
jgi:ribose-phosphate pyrophosphokinase